MEWEERRHRGREVKSRREIARWIPVAEGARGSGKTVIRDGDQPHKSVSGR